MVLETLVQYIFSEWSNHKKRGLTQQMYDDGKQL
jgi:hypothetical protein